MAGNQRKKENYAESWARTWVLIIIAAGIVVALGLNGAAAVIIGAGLVIGFAIASKR